jgi:hypothetical protein
MSDEGAKVVIGGDATGAVAAAKEAAEAVSENVAKMREAMDGLSEKFELITRGFAAVTAAVEGGEALKEFVEASLEVATSAVTLGRALGVSTTEASTFKSALSEVGVGQDVVALAGKRITMALAAGGEKFKALGIATRDANGDLRNSKDIMLDVNEKLRGFKEGTDRNVEAQKIYGRSYQDLMPLIVRLTDLSVDGANKRAAAAEASALREGKSHEEAEEAGKKAFEAATSQQEEAKEKAQALNLVVGQESVAAALAYTDAQTGMHEVMEGIENTIGQALIPKLTAMANFFSSIGPTAVSIMQGVMTTYMTVQDAVTDSVSELWDTFKNVFASIGDVITDVFGPSSEPMTGMKFFSNVLKVIEIAVIDASASIRGGMNVIGGAISEVIVTVVHAATAFQNLLHGDFAGAKAAWEDWSRETDAIITKTVNKGVEIAETASAKVAALLEASSDPTKVKKQTPTTATGGGKHSDAGQGSGKAQGDPQAKAAGEAELARQKEVLAEAEKANEVSYQQQSIDVKAFYAAKRKYAEDALDLEIAQKLKEASQAKALADQETGDMGKRNALLAVAIKLEGDAAVMSLKRKQVGVDTAAELVKAEKELDKKIGEEHAASAKKLGEIDIDAQTARLGEISASQELASQRQLLDTKLANDKAYYDALAPLYANDKAAQQKNMDAIRALNAQYNLDVQKADAATAAETMKDWKTSLDGVTADFATGLQQMLNHSFTFRSAQKTLEDQMLKSATEWIAKKAETWIVHEAMQTLATLTGNASRTASSVEADGLAAASSGSSSILQILNSAYTAAAGAFSSQASIPYVGPELGAAASIAALALVGGMVGSVASARGGYDIPAGTNPLTQLHEKEMVLPEGPAETLRSLKNGGGGDTHLHVHTMDTKGVKAFLGQNSHHIAAALKGQNSKFGLT